MAQTQSIYNQGLYNQDGALYAGGINPIEENPTDSIVFNDFGLQNANYISVYPQDMSAPNRDMVLSSVPRDHGMNLQDAFFKRKKIIVKGVLKTSTNSELLTQMDLMKKFLAKINGELKITENNVTRVYTATVVNMDRLFPVRAYYNIIWLDYLIEFECFTPFGRDEEQTVRSHFTRTAATINTEMTNEGTIETRLQAFILFDIVNDVSKVNLKNNTNTEEIEITRAFAANEILTIDGETQEVAVDGVGVDYDGSPPKLETGANSLTFTITSTSHQINITLKHYNSYL